MTRLMGLEGAAISPVVLQPPKERKEQAMKIRERCNCGAEFEMRSKSAADVYHELLAWRENHRCNRLIERETPA